MASDMTGTFFLKQEHSMAALQLKKLQEKAHNYLFKLIKLTSIQFKINSLKAGDMTDTFFLKQEHNMVALQLKKCRKKSAQLFVQADQIDQYLVIFNTVFFIGIFEEFFTVTKKKG